MRLQLRPVIVVLALVAGLAGGAAGQEPPSTITLGNDRYMAGGSVTFDGMLEGELYAAGGDVRVSGQISENVMLAGGTVRLTGTVADDARIAGGTVELDQAAISGTALLAGGTIRIDEATTIGQSLVAAGGTVDVGGIVQGGARLAGREVRLSGRIDGPIELNGERLVVRPTARIEGPISYSSPGEIVIEPGAAVTGSVIRRPWEQPTWMGTPGGTFAGSLLFALMIGLGLALLAWLLERAFPRAMGPVAQTVGDNPWGSLAAGLGGLLLLPAVALFLLLTIIGAPLSMLAMLFWGLAILTSRLFVGLYLAGRIVASRRLSPTPERLAGWTALVVLLLTLLVALPYLGWWIRLAIVCFGFGALLITLWQRRTRRPTPVGAQVEPPVTTTGIPERPMPTYPLGPAET